MLSALLNGLTFALKLWWVWLPVLLVIIAYDVWFDYQLEKYLVEMKWVLLEIIPPLEIRYSSPRAAEYFFSGLHASYGGGTGWKGQFFTGKVPDWFSIEIASNSGDTHFYIRCLEGQRNTLESILFAQYPDAEIRIVEDYMDQVPAVFKPDKYDLSCSEFIFSEAQAYPIKTYPEFEDAGGKDEYARLDPLAPLLEIMSGLRAGEHIWLQFMLRPTGKDWIKEQQKVVDKLAGKEEKQADPHPIVWILSLPLKIITALLEEFGLQKPVEEKKKEEKKEEKQFNLQGLTPAQKVILERVEYKLSKLAFKVGIRLCYIADKDVYNGARPASVGAMFKQLYYTNLNSFKPNPKASSSDKGTLGWLFPDGKGFGVEARTLQKKTSMYKKHRERKFTKDFVILNVEELATIWHLPGANIKAPLISRIQAKKGQPPAMLPTRQLR